MDNGNGDYVTYTYDKYGNIKEKYTNGTLTYQGVADNIGAITKVIDPVNNLSYNSSYDSTDRLIGTTVTDTTTGARRAEFEYNSSITVFISLTSRPQRPQARLRSSMSTEKGISRADQRSRVVKK